MSLLNGEVDAYKGDIIRDCVAKRGFCEIVTDPKTNQLLRKEVMFDQTGNYIYNSEKIEYTKEGLKDFLSGTSQPSVKEIVKEEVCDNSKKIPILDIKEVPPESSTNNEELMATALLEILQKLTNIEELLQYK